RTRRGGPRAALDVRRRVRAPRIGAPGKRLRRGGLRETAIRERDGHDRARGKGGTRVTAARGRVLLINPRITSRRHARFPLSIRSMAAALADRHDVTLIDGNMDRDAARSAADAVASERFDAVGVTVMGGPQVATAIAVSRAVRGARPDVPIVWGGYFPTLYPEVALSAAYVDFVIRGQGETTLRELVEA